MLHIWTWSAHEERLLRRGVFGNVGNVIRGSATEHIIEPVKSGNFPKAIAGIPITALDTVLTAPDAAIAGLVGEDIEPLPAVTLARTRRDVSRTVGHAADAVGNLVTFHPVESVKSLGKGVLSTVRLTGDLPMDGLDALGGYDVVDRARASTRYAAYKSVA